ncbi:MAG TPA: acetoacetate--CoA ligase [Chloroflexota bacterium]|nr:acetoacetate--CoA ligase [Chloroflexota bacterium]
MSAALAEGDLLWEPSESFKSGSRLAAYMRWLAERDAGRRFETYDALWRWSVADLEAFWVSIVEFFGVQFARPAARVLGERSMPGARWFEGAELNYAQNVFRHVSEQSPALMFQSESRPLTPLAWSELEAQVASVADGLRAMGVKRGDRVVAYMPNIPETVVAFLAAASLGAIWSSCSPDFGVDAVLDRFAQIEPAVLFAVDGYTYGGKAFSKLDTVRELVKGLPTLTHAVLVSNAASRISAESSELPLTDSPDPAGSERSDAGSTPVSVRWETVLATHSGARLRFEPVAFDHPLWVLYSSGTTGLPKALVHSHGGVVLEHVKLLGLHTNLGPGDRLFWYTSTGWMMWNFIVGGLLVGATPVLFDGNPAYPDLDTLWRLAEQAKLKLFGTSAAYIMNCLKNGLQPKQRHDLSALECIGSTGSPLPSEGFGWVYEHVKEDLWLASVSGGTDVVSAFVVGCPLLPVRAGELQCRALGASVDAFDERGQSLVDATGELVITQPMPSMPVFLWNDDQAFSRYRASYFDMYPGVWRHGDWIRLTSRGSAVIQGRSDSTLNRLGVRIGTSEVYSAIESLPEIRDSLVLGLELPKGGYYMPLFVVLAEGVELTDELKAKINATIRTQCSPRHIPDEIVGVPAIPRTLSDKKMEVPVKKLFMGVPVAKAANVGATRSPAAVEYFAELARRTSPLLTTPHT